MRSLKGTFAAASVALLVAAVGLQAQQKIDGTVESHLAAAKKAAGTQFTALQERVCESAIPAPPRTGGAGPAGGGGRQAGPPPASAWHVEPAKVFDNLYFVGMTDWSAWALTTSQGIIVIDAIFDYSVEDEVVNGLKKLGLNPADIKYVLVSHAHTDHIGGAKYLQDHFGARLVMSKEDWDLSDRTIPERIRPKRDIEAKDGDTLTLGDATIKMYITPGHTPGTVSSIYKVKDRGATHTVATWGGTTIQGGKPETYLAYIASADRYKDIVKKAGADIVLSNHTAYDNTPANIKQLARRGASNPYVVGNTAVLRYITTAEECAKAGYLATTKLAGTSSR
ncbi:MAG TPA: MBL fold metallo-hydrolase [Vicinamibacterales bacterium]|nr:MBL fold metallo-hydrolase [Vicinamibacterales bacterium]